MICRASEYFTTLEAQGFVPPGQRVRSMVAEYLRVGSASVTRVSGREEGEYDPLNHGA